MAKEVQQKRGRPAGSANSRRRQRSTIEAPPAQSGTRLLENVNGLILQNKALKKENDRLKALLARVAGLVTTEAAGRVPVQRINTQSKRRATAGSSQPATSATPAKKTRRPITDPIAIEKRRAALAKARAVHAERKSQMDATPLTEA